MKMADSSTDSTVTEVLPPAPPDMKNAAMSKPLQMSFSDWKKCKEALGKPESETQDSGAQRNGRKPQNNNANKQQQRQQGVVGQKNQNRGANHASLSRPPPLPLPLMSINFGNFGPCGPPPMSMPMPPPCNMGMGPGSGRRNHRPPPFWEDMMSPQHRPPPIQPPMPKCPSLWNLVPKEKGYQGNNNNRRQNNQQQHNKKQKPNSNNTKPTNNQSKDAALMPPPPPPAAGGSSNSSQVNGAQPAAKKARKKAGTFVHIDGQWVLKPEAPQPLGETPSGTKEERQRQWKEYRQAMKPFKNREFHNWKRTVQRLGKLPRDQLDEKQLERLQKAEEYIGAHKAMLTIKHAERWVPQENQAESNAATNTQGQVFVRKPVSTYWDKKSGTGEPNPFRRGLQAKKYIGTGRAIKGGGVDPNVMPPQPTTIGHYPYPPPEHHQQQQALENARPVISTGYFSQTYGQEPHTSTSFYSGYSSHFIKSDTLLPP